MGKGGSVSVTERTVMDGATPVNTGVVAWPSVDAAGVMVRRMQAKLHRWASEDSARRFGDLFNLVYDPAFLVDAWPITTGHEPRVSTGSRWPRSRPGSGLACSWARSGTC